MCQPEAVGVCLAAFKLVGPLGRHGKANSLRYLCAVYSVVVRVIRITGSLFFMFCYFFAAGVGKPFSRCHARLP